MSTYSYRSQGQGGGKDPSNFPVITESEPPSFPRPSSSIARSRLKNRLISKNPAAVQNQKLLPTPPQHDRDDEFRHQLRHDNDHDHYYGNDGGSVSSRHYRGGYLDAPSQVGALPQQDSINDSQYSVRFGSTDVIESFALGGGGDDESVAKHQPSDDNTRYLHSKIIPSHSLYVPGYESTVPRPPIVQQSQSGTIGSNNDPSIVVLSTAYGKSFQSDAMEDAVELILSGQKEFCYLKEVDPDDQYRLVLSFSSVSSEANPGRYTTLSAKGVVRYYDGGMDSVSLREYLREYKYYYRLREIPVIGQFRLWKSFLIFKIHVLATRRKKRMMYLLPHLFILDESFQTLLLYVHNSAITLNNREVTRLTKVLFKITSPSFFEIQDDLNQNRSPITKNDLAPKKFELEGGPNKVSEICDPVEITLSMSKEEVLFHIVSCIYLKVGSRQEHVVKNVVPQSLLEPNFRYQVSMFCEVS
jgi:hypothetical protein